MIKKSGTPSTSLSDNYGTILKNSAPVKTVRVPLGPRSYPIYIGENLLTGLGPLFSRHNLPRQVVVVTDRNVARLYLAPVVRSLRNSGFGVRSIVVPPGEKQKSLRRADAIFSELIRWRIERRSTIVALGGGVVGDLSGFVAATYQRGINFVQVPTTLLAQVDSSVGGKVGVNHPQGKNMIGSFYQPVFVAADVSTLRSLPRRELVCGLGEVVKYGIIMNKGFFSYTRGHIHDALRMDQKVLSRIVTECCRMKAFVVSKDEREKGLRAILNFGHTVGHALELAGKYRVLKHGEAILMGMAAESFIAYRLGLLSPSEAGRIERAVLSVPLPPLSGLNVSPKNLLSTMRVDKKVEGARIRMVLPASIGNVRLPQPVEERSIIDGVSYLQGLMASARHPHVG